MTDEALTAAEQAYLDSGGENAEGLVKENPAITPATQEPTPHAAPQAPQQEVDDETGEPIDPKGMVPVQKYQRDRKRLREQLAAKDREAAELRDRLSRGDERLKLLSEVMTPVQQEGGQQEDDDPEPDPDEDLVAYVQWQRRENGRLREAIVQTHGATHATQEAMRASAQEAQVQQAYQQDAIDFGRTTPDFLDAYVHMLNTRGRMLQELGHNPQQIAQILRNEERGLVQQAFANRKRPAKIIYSMAKSMGYQPNTNGKGNGQNGTRNGNGAANGSVTAQIERIQRGQNASKSLSDAGGSGNSELTVEALAAMTDREFEALYAKKRGEVDAILGKR